MILSPSEMKELTGFARPAQQRRELHAMGIPYRVRSDGKVVVLRADLGLTPQRKKPDFSSLRL